MSLEHREEYHLVYFHANEKLGLGIVKALIRTYCARVVVLSRSDSDELSALPSTFLHHIQCDITQEGTAKSAITETLKKFGRLDSIVLNAGTLEPVTKLENAESSAWKECFNVNVFSNISLVRFMCIFAYNRLKKEFLIFVYLAAQ